MNSKALIAILQNELERADDYGRFISKHPERALREGLSRTAGIAKRFAKILRKRDYAGLDEFFFSRESMPIGGKEYWFLELVSTAGDKKQLILTFGSSDLNTRVNGKAAIGGTVAVVGWLYSDRRKVFLEKSCRLYCEKGSLKTNDFSFTGKYPNYELAIGKETHVKFSKSQRGAAYEKAMTFAGTLGVGMQNLYLDAKGNVDGKKFEGVSYLQKVVVVAPFIPWNWARIVFPDRSVLDFFSIRIDMKAVGYDLRVSAKYQLPSGKTMELKDAHLRRLANGRWLLEGNGFSAYLKTYAAKPFVLRGRGEFHYDEYMAECVDFTFGKTEKHGGIGIVEDAYGFMI